MGLLDDAIREHLDLKRARGSDPAEIERMEREALGPVRREPTIGSSRFEAVDEHVPFASEPGHPEEHFADLEELQDLGYHDSTAPHPNPHRRSQDEPRFALGDAETFEDEREQPRRRFLRRNRPASLGDQAAPDPGFHELEPEPYDPLDHHDSLEPFDPLEHHNELEDPELSAREEHEDPDATRQHVLPEEAAPPHVQFEKPPKRPRFTSDPPLEPLTDEVPSAASEPQAASPSPRDQAPGQAYVTPEQMPFDEPDEPQETTEFDVQEHIAEHRHRPDEENVRARPAAPDKPPTDEDEDEDVLEETPDFLQDTPEHDRLWFEQRPPKDFDFDG